MSAAYYLPHAPQSSGQESTREACGLSFAGIWLPTADGFAFVARLPTWDATYELIKRYLDESTRETATSLLNHARAARIKWSKTKANPFVTPVISSTLLLTNEDPTPFIHKMQQLDGSPQFQPVLVARLGPQKSLRTALRSLLQSFVAAGNSLEGTSEVAKTTLMDKKSSLLSNNMRDLDLWYQERYYDRPSKQVPEDSDELPKLMPTLLIHFSLPEIPATLINDLIHILILYATRLPIAFLFHTPSPTTLQSMSSQTLGRLDVSTITADFSFDSLLDVITTNNPCPEKTLLLSKELVDFLREAYEGSNKSIDAFLSGLHYAHLAHSNIYTSPPTPSLLRSLPSFRRYISRALSKDHQNIHNTNINPSDMLTSDLHLLQAYEHFYSLHLSFQTVQYSNNHVLSACSQTFGGTRGWERIRSTDASTLLTFLTTVGWDVEVNQLQNLIEDRFGEGGRRNLINGLLLGAVAGTQMGDLDWKFTKMVEEVDRKVKAVVEGTGEKAYESLVFWELWYIDCSKVVRQVLYPSPYPEIIHSLMHPQTHRPHILPANPRSHSHTSDVTHVSNGQPNPVDTSVVPDIVHLYNRLSSAPNAKYLNLSDLYDGFRSSVHSSSNEGTSPSKRSPSKKNASKKEETNIQARFISAVADAAVLGLVGGHKKGDEVSVIRRAW